MGLVRGSDGTIKTAVAACHLSLDWPASTCGTVADTCVYNNFETGSNLCGCPTVQVSNQGYVVYQALYVFAVDLGEEMGHHERLSNRQDCHTAMRPQPLAVSR